MKSDGDDDDALESSISAEITHTGCVRNHTHTVYRRTGQAHRATAERYPHRNTPRKGKTRPNNGCTKPHSSCSQGHGALQHMYSPEDRRRQGKLARSNLSPHRPHTITRLTINPGTRRSTSTQVLLLLLLTRHSGIRRSRTRPRGGDQHVSKKNFSGIRCRRSVSHGRRLV
jgi:hypothetical protein